MVSKSSIAGHLPVWRRWVFQSTSYVWSSEIGVARTQTGAAQAGKCPALCENDLATKAWQILGLLDGSGQEPVDYGNAITLRAAIEIGAGSGAECRARAARWLRIKNCRLGWV